LVVSESRASSGEIAPKDFFNFNFAVHLWKNTSGNELDEVFEVVCIDDKFLEKWKRRYENAPKEALNELENRPDVETLKKCYDTELAYKVWNEIYDTWRGGLYAYGGEGWNKNDNHKMRGLIEYKNIFTGEINDIPDWRMPKNIVEDEENMAIGNARWANKSTE